MFDFIFASELEALGMKSRNLSSPLERDGIRIFANCLEIEFSWLAIS